MSNPIAYQLNQNGIYIGVVPRQSSPLEPGVWLLPGGAVETAPPEISAGQQARWDNGAWVLEAIPAPPAPAPDPGA